MFAKLRNQALLVSSCTLLTVFSGCASFRPSPEMPAYGTMGKAQIFEGMGRHGRVITTDSREAQEYFNQGLSWIYAVNHDEAVRSFTQAAQLDPNCAMAWWGVSYTQGPNYNDPFMSPARSAAAWEAMQNALARIDDTAPVERALIKALQSRYENPPPKERDRLDRAFAEAMAGVWERFPNDSDVGTPTA